MSTLTLNGTPIKFDYWTAYAGGQWFSLEGEGGIDYRFETDGGGMASFEGAYHKGEWCPSQDWGKAYPKVRVYNGAIKIEGWVEPTPPQPQTQNQSTVDWFWEMLNNGGAYNPPSSTPTSTPTPTPTPIPAPPNLNTREGMREIMVKEGKAGYRRLALLHHPDKGGDVEKFRILAELWEVLK